MDEENCKPNLRGHLRRWRMNSGIRRGGPSAVTTALVLAALVLLNLFVTLLGERVTLKVDLTATGVYGLSAQSLDFLAGLEDDVQVTVLSDRATFVGLNQYFAQAVEVLERFARENEHLHLQFLDLVKNPNLAAKYPQESLSAADVIVESGEKARILGVTELFNVQESLYGYNILSSKVEQALVTSILAVTSAEQTVVSILSGHGEEPVDSLNSLLSDNQYRIVNQNLSAQGIDQEAKLVIIAAPIRDYEVDDLQKLDSFLQGGEDRAVFYLASTTQPALPNLEGWLSRHGVQVERGAVFETDTGRIFNYNPYFPAVQYAEEHFSKGLLERGLICSVPYARPLSLSGQMDSQVLLQFSDSAGVMPETADENWQPTQEDLHPGIPALTLSSVDSGGKVLVCSSLLAVDESLLNSTSLNNAQFLLNVLGELTDRSTLAPIAPKELGGAQLAITTAQVSQLGLVAMVFLPLVLLFAGVVVWLSRRRR